MPKTAISMPKNCLAETLSPRKAQPPSSTSTVLLWPSTCRSTVNGQNKVQILDAPVIQLCLSVRFSASRGGEQAACNCQRTKDASQLQCCWQLTRMRLREAKWGKRGGGGGLHLDRDTRARIACCNEAGPIRGVSHGAQKEAKGSEAPGRRLQRSGPGRRTGSH